MDLTLVTVAFDPVSGGFPPRPLAQVSGEIVHVVEHFYLHNGVPHFTFVVHHNDPETERTRREKRDVRATLTEEERPVYDRLRTWRNARAEADGVPPYVIFSNRELAGIVRRRPATDTAMKAVEGIGEAKAGRYGSAVIEVLRTPVPERAP